MSEANPAATRVYDELRRQIMTWQLPPGTALREVQIAGEFGVSRTPVSHAIQRLRADGLIEPRGRRGVEVSRWNQRDLEDTYRLRANLEAWAATYAAGPWLERTPVCRSRTRMELLTSDRRLS
ncbi:GntR family transcriptional regulator [Saccharopolyspora karakumensis]|uniref:GntR family transcriptional regulator n=1 Tax=Saccharopolyspora karakumensis TaxID=2530386 RepID=A0A4R5BY20_9PSEU|nr:GntR family transcriptional regulator [Saccharopolyspora karakumensis]TDD90603.1 GntR family transcriptional regulator [Saccharopolyspora karakumensis]